HRLPGASRVDVFNGLINRLGTLIIDNPDSRSAREGKTTSMFVSRSQHAPPTCSVTLDPCIHWRGPGVGSMTWVDWKARSTNLDELKWCRSSWTRYIGVKTEEAVLWRQPIFRRT